MTLPKTQLYSTNLSANADVSIILSSSITKGQTKKSDKNPFTLTQEIMTNLDYFMKEVTKKNCFDFFRKDEGLENHTEPDRMIWLKKN